MFCSITLFPTSLRQGFSLKLKLGWWPASLSNPPASAPQGAEVAGEERSRTFIVGALNPTLLSFLVFFFQFYLHLFYAELIPVP